MSVLTFASIDIGSYDVTLEIFEISRKNSIHSVDRIKKRMELGRDAFQTGRIGLDMAERLCETMVEFRRILDGYSVDAVRAIATSALREAENDLFIRDKIRQLTGISVEILSNSEQRYLSYKAIASLENRFQDMIRSGTAIVDLGGGSVQVSLFDEGNLITTQNLKLGSLRIRELLRPLMARTEDFEGLMRELIDYHLENFRALHIGQREIRNLILSGDFATDQIFSASSSREDRTLTRQEFADWYQELAGTSLQDLEITHSLSREDASLIRPSAVIYDGFIRLMEPSVIWVPGTHLARGLAYEYAEKKNLLRSARNFEDDIISSARHIARRYEVMQAHIENMEMTSLAIYDAMSNIHGLGRRSRLLLRIGVLLHDVGKYISYNYLAENSYNIIMSNEIIGLSHAERELIALTARYNTEVFPTYEIFSQVSSLDRKSYLKAAYLVAIIRFANALDASHRQKIRSVRAVRQDRDLVITISCRESFTLERGLIASQQAFFRDVFGVLPQISELAD